MRQLLRILCFLVVRNDPRNSAATDLQSRVVVLIHSYHDTIIIGGRHDRRMNTANGNNTVIFFQRRQFISQLFAIAFLGQKHHYIEKDKQNGNHTHWAEKRFHKALGRRCSRFAYEQRPQAPAIGDYKKWAIEHFQCPWGLIIVMFLIAQTISRGIIRPYVHTHKPTIPLPVTDLFDASNLPAWPPNDPDITRALHDAIASGCWGNHDQTLLDQLACALTDRFDAGHAVLCSSGTAAIEIALKALQIKPADRIAIAGFDYPGNLRAIEGSNAVPVLVDLAPDRWTLDLDGVKTALANGVTAVIASHLYGDCFDAKELRTLCDRHGAYLIEDACQAHGASIAGKAAGSWGHIGLLSFGHSKLITSASGGALLTSDARIAQRARLANERPSPVAPLTPLQAASLLPQLAKLDERNAIRRARLRQLHERLEGSPLWGGVRGTATNSKPVFYKAAWQIDAPWQRNALVVQGQQAGIPLGGGFPGFLRRAKRKYVGIGQLENSQRCVERCLVMHHRVLMSEETLIDIVAHVLQDLETQC